MVEPELQPLRVTRTCALLALAQLRAYGIDPIAARATRVNKGVGGRGAVPLRSRDARGSREYAARALDDDWPQVLAALRRGLEDKDAGKAARTAVAYVQLVYGRQLQQPEDEQPADPLDVSAMTREQRNALKRRILEKHPHLVQELTGDIDEGGA
jgi:hypothetical protein